MKAKYCSNCGAKIIENASFCRECGKKIIRPLENIEVQSSNCPKCGREFEKDEKFCAECGTSKGENVIKNKQTSQKRIITKSKPQPLSTIKSNPSKKKKKGGILRTIGKIVLGFVAFAIVGSIILYNLGDDLEDATISQEEIVDYSNDTNIDDFVNINTIDDFAGIEEISVDENELEISNEMTPKVKPSGTKAVNIEPIKGVILQADENALDKERNFKVRKLNFNELSKLIDKMPNTGVIPVKAIDIDSEMKADEHFPGVLNVEIDLNELGIPKDMWEFMDVVRIDGNEDGVPMHAVSKNGKLKFSTSRNSVFVFVGLTIGMSGALGLNVNKLRGQKFGNKKLVYTNIYKGYYLYWPKELPSAKPKEVEKQYNKLKSIAKKHGYEEKDLKSLYDDEEGFFNFLYTIYGDSDFKKTLKLMKTKDWQKDNFYPEFVGKTLNHINEAHKYLFETRKIKRPKHIDYIIRDPWPHKASQLGITDGSSWETVTYLQHLYIHLKYEKGKIDWANQFVTIVHETFHIAQNEYFFSNNLTNLFFCEASALKIQFDANNCLEKGYVEVPSDREVCLDQAQRTFGDKNNVLKIPYEEWKKEIQNQGYFYSYYLDELEKFHNRYNSSDFMLSTLSKYKTTKDPIKALLSINKGRSVFFRYFFIKRTKDFIKRAKDIEIKSTDKPSVTSIITKPFSAVINRYCVTTSGANKKPRYVFRATKGIIDSKKLNILLCNEKGNTAEIKEPSVEDGEIYDIAIPKKYTNRVKLKKNNKAEVIIEQIQYSEDVSASGKFSLYIMQQPEKPTIESKDENTISIKFNESKQSPDFIGSYQVYIKYPKGDVYKIESKTTQFDAPAKQEGDNVIVYLKKNKEIVSVEKFNLTQKQSIKFKDNKYSVKYGEITNSKQKIVGPHSEVSEMNGKAEITITGERSILYEVKVGKKVKHQFEAISDYTGDCYIKWNFGDDGNGVIENKNNSKITHKFEENGKFTVSAKLFDNNNQLLAEDSINLEIEFEVMEMDEEDNSNNIKLIAYVTVFDLKNGHMEIDNNLGIETLEGYNIEAHEVYPGYDVNFIVKDGDKMANEKYKYTWIVNGVKDNSAGDYGVWGNNFSLRVENKPRDWSDKIKGGVIGIGLTTVCVEVYNSNGNFIGKDCWSITVIDTSKDTYKIDDIMPDGDEF